MRQIDSLSKRGSDLKMIIVSEIIDVTQISDMLSVLGFFNFILSLVDCFRSNLFCLLDLLISTLYDISNLILI